jgi:hypothetical protein
MAKIYVSVTPEQSSLIQQVYIKLGYSWFGAYNNNRVFEVKWTDAPYLVLDSEEKRFSYSRNLTDLVNTEQVYTFENLMGFLNTSKPLEPQKEDNLVAKIKEGDLVYCILYNKLDLKQVDKIEQDCAVFVGGGAVALKYCFLATDENYQTISKLLPDLQVEKPVTVLKGSEATKHLLQTGTLRQICYVGDQSDFKCRSNDITELAVVVSYNPNTNVFVTDAGEVYAYAVPVDGNDNSIEIKI